MSVCSVLITCCNTYIGLEFVNKFLSLDNPPKHVFAACPNPDEADDLQKLAQSNSNLKIVTLDVKDIDSFPEVCQQISKVVGDSGLNLIINTAGVLFDDSLDEPMKNNFIENVEVNSVSPLLLTKEFLPLLEKAASSENTKVLSCCRAGVVNITSTMGSIDDNTSRGRYPYRTKKTALNVVTKWSDLKPLGILTFDLYSGSSLTDIGGKKVFITTESSVSGMMKQILTATDHHSGGFFHHDGKQIPWNATEVCDDIVNIEPIGSTNETEFQNEIAALRIERERVENTLMQVNTIQSELYSLENEFCKDAMNMQLQYETLYSDLYKRRSEVIKGNVAVDSPHSISKPGEERNDGKSTTGIRSFWLKTFLNIPYLRLIIEKADRAALENLIDVMYRVTLEPHGFVLIFEFQENEYFVNKVLTKSYVFDEFDQFQIQSRPWKIRSTVGCNIIWFPHKSLCDSVVTDNTSDSSRFSFFHFFKSRAQEDIQPFNKAIEFALRHEDKIGEILFSKVIKNPIPFFTGDTLFSEDKEYKMVNDVIKQSESPEEEEEDDENNENSDNSDNEEDLFQDEGEQQVNDGEESESPEEDNESFDNSDNEDEDLFQDEGEQQCGVKRKRF